MALPTDADARSSPPPIDLDGPKAYAAPEDYPRPQRVGGYAKRVLLTTCLASGVVLLIIFLYYASRVLLLMFAGVLLAVLLRSLADGIKRLTRLSDAWSLVVTGLLLILAIGGFGWWVAPQVSEQADQLSEAIPRSIESAQNRLQEFGWGRWIIGMASGVPVIDPDVPLIPDNGDRAGPPAPAEVPRGRAGDSGEAGGFGGDNPIFRFVPGILGSVFTALFSLFIVFFVGVYLAINPRIYESGTLRLVPIRHRKKAVDVLAALQYTLRWWLLGQLFTMSCVAVMTTLALWLLGIPLAIALGLIAGLLDFIPNFGPIIAAVPGVLLALAISPTKALWVTLAYVVVQQIESFVIAPLVHQRTVHLPPVLTIVSQVFLGLIAGPLGLLLATPLLAVLLVLVKMLYVEETLGDEMDTPDDHIAEEQKPALPHTQVKPAEEVEVR